MHFRLLSLILLFQILPRAYCDDFRNCFKRISRRSIGNYAPIAEYRNTPLTMCTQHCVMAAGNGRDGGSICKSFTYESSKKLCKLFDHDGHKVPAVIHPVIGIDIFYRTSDQGNCAGPISGQKVNLNFAQLNSHKDLHKKEIEKKDITNPKDDQFMEKARALSSPIVKMDNLDTILRSKLRGDDVLVPMSQPNEKQEQIETNPPLQCDTSRGFYVVIGNEIVLPISGGAVKVYNNVEQGDCAKYCSDNKGPDEETIICRSLNYFPYDQKCELYGILAEPHGTGKLMENEKVIYAEKFCLPESPYVCQEDEIFILHAAKTIKKRKLSTKSAKSITDCLRRCLSHDQCRSSVFHSNEMQCDLYDVDGTDVNYIRDSGEDSVIIENSCRREGVTPQRRITSSSDNENEDSSEGWSGCDYKVDGRQVKVRTNDSGELETKEC
ncbi:unnamed protein product [Caenorhabditis bovis]|uniref:Apple domain-containing protein n=1 Tax=Caenorhabditis bovis TaxID=2654633 RepID=A0A8S1ES34_9PELO|nr:unnamed protein product [Caenorhabditis bovis]